MVGGAPLSPAGDWTLQIVARVSEFDEHRTDVHGPDQVKEPMRTLIPAAVAALALALPAAAVAHVTVQPNTAQEGGFARLDVRVPNERDDAGTVKVDVKMPPGFAFASYEPVPGWSVKIAKEKLDEPIEIDGLEMTEQISRITWTGNPKQGGIIEPGQFQDFGLSVGIPDGKPGAKLTFKALQTYEGGEVVRWIGPEDAEEPAPTVTLTSGGAGGGHGAPGAAAPGAAAPAPPPAASTSDDGGSDGLAIAALVVGRARPARGRRRPARRPPRTRIHPSLKRGDRMSPRPFAVAVIAGFVALHAREQPRAHPDQVRLAAGPAPAPTATCAPCGDVPRRDRGRRADRPERKRREGQPRQGPPRARRPAAAGAAAPGPRPGSYRATVRWLSSDGHVQTKSWSFRIR